MNNGFGLKKEERLCSKKAIDALFAGTDSKSLSAYPIRAVFRHSAEPGVRILVSVSKRRFHNAVDRNRVKRQLREAYRLNKNILHSTTAETCGMDIAFIWLTDRHETSELVSTRMISLLDKIHHYRPSTTTL